MAGAGFKTFNTGDVLTASDVNTYLMQQTVMVFDDASARSTALPTPSEGMFSYLKDTNLTYRYDGSAWLSDAGTTSPLTTKGDVWGYSTTDARIPVGANGTVLTADSAEALGVKWAAPAATVNTVNWVRLTSGTSWSVPAGIKTATIWCIGGGGGGASGRGDGNKYSGGGGGAGGLRMGTFDLSSVAGSTITYAIGSGGAGGAQSTGVGNNGTNGGNTTFGTSGQAWYLSATGGGGGGTQANGVLGGGCGGGGGGANANASGGGGGGGISSHGNSAQWKAATDFVGIGTQGNNGGRGGAGSDGNQSGLGGSGIFINNFGVGGGGHGGYQDGNGYTSANTTWGAAGPVGSSAPTNSTANTGAGGPGGGNAVANNTGSAGGNGGSGVIFIQYLS